MSTFHSPRTDIHCEKPERSDVTSQSRIMSSSAQDKLFKANIFQSNLEGSSKFVVIDGEGDKYHQLQHVSFNECHFPPKYY